MRGSKRSYLGGGVRYPFEGGPDAQKDAIREARVFAMRVPAASPLFLEHPGASRRLPGLSGMYTPPARWVKSQDRIAQRPALVRWNRDAEITYKFKEPIRTHVTESSQAI